MRAVYIIQLKGLKAKLKKVKFRKITVKSIENSFSTSES